MDVVFRWLTWEAIFGDLQRPGAPTQLFESEPPADNTILVIRKKPGVELQADEVLRLRAAVQRVVNETVGARMVVSVPIAAESIPPDL